MIAFNGKYYKLNLDKICSFAFTSEKQPAEREIIDNYTFENSNDKKLSQKTVREFQSYSYDGIKYDLIKSLIFQLLSYDFSDEMIDVSGLPIGISICLNTLISDGFLVEIQKEKKKN